MSGKINFHIKTVRRKRVRRVSKLKEWFLIHIRNKCPICGCELWKFYDAVKGKAYKKCTCKACGGE